MNMESIIYFIFGVITTCTIIGVTWVITSNRDEKNKALVQTPTQRIQPLSFDDCETVITSTITEIYENKFLLQYKLKEIKIIPNMEQDIRDIVNEVMNALSDNFITSLNQYYTRDYLVQRIVRQAQLLLIDYTNQNKPNTK